MVLPDHIEVVPTGPDEQTVSAGDECWVVRATAVPTEYEVTDDLGGTFILYGYSSLDDAVRGLLSSVWPEQDDEVFPMTER